MKEKPDSTGRSMTYGNPAYALNWPMTIVDGVPLNPRKLRKTQTAGRPLHVYSPGLLVQLENKAKGQVAQYAGTSGLILRTVY